MAKFAVLALMLLAVSGCCRFCQPKTVTVEKRVRYCPMPQPTELPEMPLTELADNAEPDEVARAWAESVEILKREVQLREQIIQQYRDLSKNDPDASSDEPSCDDKDKSGCPYASVN